MGTLKDQVVIAGVGQTEYSKNSGVSTLSLATQCAREAIADAGMTPQDIDGMILFYLQEPLSCHEIAANLGIPQLNWSLNIAGGGNNGPAIVTAAAAAIATGLAKNVICLHAINRRSSGRRPGGGGGGGGGGRWNGQTAAPQGFALWARRHMHEFGTKQEHLGQIAVSVRKHASLNPLAIMRQPITLEDYHSSRWITSPFHVFDCCLESDGGAALVLTGADRARDLPKPPVYIMAGVANCWGPVANDAPDGPSYASLATYTAKNLWERAGVGPKDMSFAQLYDCFTYTLLTQLEDYGFCAKGEGGPFVEGGQRIELGGQLPVNTSGGQLSEAYVRSMSLFNEAVRQLRGEYAGTPRQVANAEMGLVTGAPNPTSAVVLRR